jgi:hypothetical protein
MFFGVSRDDNTPYLYLPGDTEGIGYNLIWEYSDELGKYVLCSTG